ncbi:MAG: hypothetical protein Q9192_006610 [Flavoplaca navasiana]
MSRFERRQGSKSRPGYLNEDVQMAISKCQEMRLKSNAPNAMIVGNSVGGAMQSLEVRPQDPKIIVDPETNMQIINAIGRNSLGGAGVDLRRAVSGCVMFRIGRSGVGPRMETLP